MMSLDDEARAERTGVIPLLFCTVLLLLAISLAAWGFYTNYGGRWLVSTALMVAGLCGADLVRIVLRLRRRGS